MFQSKDQSFNDVKEFHARMDGQTQEVPKVFDQNTALHRAGFKIEEILEFLQTTVQTDRAFDQVVSQVHELVDQAARKCRRKGFDKDPLVGQVDGLVDLLYLTYGSFVLMGVDPAPIFEIVHRANMGKIFPDGTAHYDPVTHKILKPDDWEKGYAPEPAIHEELQKQLHRFSNEQ